MEGLQPVSLDPLRIAVLAGGDSAEREISLQSGAAIAAALSDRCHPVVTVDPAVIEIESHDWSQVDMAFLALHGTFGEDGGVQSLLARLGVPFTGSGADVSRLAFSKSAAKERFNQAGVSTPEYALIHSTDTPERIAEHADSIGYPLVVKPDAQGSSLGVSIVESADDLKAAVSSCFDLGDFGLLERMVIGSEWTLAVINDHSLPLIRIGTGREFFDYAAKYQDDATDYGFDTETDAATLEHLTETGLTACRRLGATEFARVDILLDDNGQAWVLEVNTIPGMTDHSLVPKAAARVGLSMGELCELIVDHALKAASPGGLRRAS